MSGTGDFETLVDSTRGLQPWRRLFHAGYGVLVVAVIVLLEPAPPMVLTALGAILAAQILLDVVRLRFPGTNALFFRAFRLLVSPREAGGFASSTWYSLGLLLALTLFPRAEALSGILVLALADPAASAGGQVWGRHKLMRGSVEGFTIFVVVATAILWLRHPGPIAPVAAIVGAVAERLSDPLDDNLTVPLVVAGVLTAGAALL